MQRKSKKYPDFIEKKDGSLREVSKAEEWLISWCFLKLLWAPKGSFFAHIPSRLADADNQCSRIFSEEWLESAKNEFINFYRKTHHRHTDLEKQIAEAFEIGSR